jgi:hypothetical protein
MRAQRGIFMSLAGLGVATELVYLLYFVAQFPLLGHYRQDTDIGTITGHSHAGFVLFIAAISILFLLFALACRETGAIPLGDPAGSGMPPGSGSAPLPDDPGANTAALDSDTPVLALILGFGALFAVTLLFVYPITATDLFSYIAQSQILVHYHQNPLITPPSQYPHDPLMQLSDGYFRYASPYGPLGILLDALPLAVVGSRLLANLLLLKALFSALALGCAYLAYRIVRQLHPRLAIGAALFIAWNPFVLLEVSVNGHNDIAMMALVLLALYAVVRERLLIAIVLLAAAAMVKYAAVFLVPLVLLYGARRQGGSEDRLTYVASALAWSFAVVAVLAAPFWHGTDTISAILSQNQRSANSLSSILYSLHTGKVGVDQTAIAGWILFLALYAVVLWRSFTSIDRLLRGCFLVLFGFLALAASNVEGWYLLWPALLAATVPFAAERACAFAFSYGSELAVVIFGYIYVWLGYDLGAVPLLNAATYVLTFIPAALVLVLLSRRATPSAVPAPGAVEPVG